MEFEKDLSLFEYLASFWNADAVTKSRNARLANEDDSGDKVSDEEFSEFINNKEYKNNKYIDIIKDLAKAKQEGKLRYKKKVDDRSSLPDDLSSISSTLNKFGEK